jgi:hypothetical protein
MVLEARLFEMNKDNKESDVDTTETVNYRTVRIISDRYSLAELK